MSGPAARMSAPYDIQAGRVVAGAIAGAVVALAYFAVQFREAWPLAVMFGGPPAAVGLVALVPIYFVLRRWQLLNVYVAILLGGVMTLTPYALVTAYDYDEPPGKYDDPLLIFVEEPMWFFGSGALGGAAGWLVAFGWRARAPRRDA